MVNDNLNRKKFSQQTIHSQRPKVRTTCKWWNLDKSIVWWTEFQHHSYYDKCLIYNYKHII